MNNFDFNMYDLKALNDFIDVGKEPDLDKQEKDALLLKGTSTPLLKFILI